MSTPTNSDLDPQNPMHRLAHQTTEELPEQPDREFEAVNNGGASLAYAKAKNIGAAGQIIRQQFPISAYLSHYPDDTVTIREIIADK